MAGTSDAITTLERFDLLGPDVNYAHGNMLTDQEFDLIAASRGTLSITPSTDMLMQFRDVPRHRTRPGTRDRLRVRRGHHLQRRTDLFSEMRLALAAERSRANADALARGELAPTVDLHQRDVLRLATVDGARVWGMHDDIGTLSRGKQADIAILDLGSPHLDGFGDPVAVMVLDAGPADVDTVIVGGDIVKRHGRLPGAHVDAARALMHETRERLRHRSEHDSADDAARIRLPLAGEAELWTRRLLGIADFVRTGSEVCVDEGDCCPTRA
jgi:cytosine/adenosine deaminase-related metal-dependent hydrolase